MHINAPDNLHRHGMGLQPPTNSLCCSTHYCLSWLSKHGEIELLCIQGRGRVSRCLLYMYMYMEYLPQVRVVLFYEPQQQTQAFKTASIRALYERVPGTGHSGPAWLWLLVVASLATLPSPHFRSYQLQWASDSTMPCHEPRPKGLSLHHSLVQGPRILSACATFFLFFFVLGWSFFQGPLPRGPRQSIHSP